MRSMGRGTARRAVEGQSRTHDRVGGCVRIGEDIRPRQPKKPQTGRFDEMGAGGVRSGPRGVRDVPIHLDREPGGGAIKIQHIRPERMLAAELHAPRSTAQSLP